MKGIKKLGNMKATKINDVYFSWMNGCGIIMWLNLFGINNEFKSKLIVSNNLYPNILRTGKIIINCRSEEIYF